MLDKLKGLNYDLTLHYKDGKLIYGYIDDDQFKELNPINGDLIAYHDLSDVISDDLIEAHYTTEEDLTPFTRYKVIPNA